MHRRVKKRLLFNAGMAMMFVVASLASSLVAMVDTAKAGDFSMQTGYYVGDGTSAKTITGVGFQPDLVIVKSATNASEGGFKTSAMPTNTASVFSAAAVDTSGQLLLSSDGFTIGAIGNTVNVYYSWIAFGGSDCSASGNFCVGTYSGDNNSNRTITTGFQPSLVINKRSTNIAAHFRTSLYPVDYSSYFVSTADATNGSLLRDFTTTGFTVGTGDNTSGSNYYFIAFKSTAGLMAEGAYTGDGTDDRSITGVGFQPDFVWIKNVTSGTSNNRRALMTNDQQPTNASSYTAVVAADISNAIQALEPDGFQLGSFAGVNENAQDFVWFAFAGVPPPTASGTFQMAVGSYTGTGLAHSITGLGFSPDLVVIKANAITYKVFRTKMMKGDFTAFISVSTGGFTGGITSLDADGFSLGTSANTNANGVVFEWQAFGNAYNPETKSGASDFAIGSYVSNNVNGTLIANVPFQADFLLTRGGSNIAAYKTSSQPATTSGFYSGAGEVTNALTGFTSDGFQLGTNSSSNVSGAIRYDWFAFKNGTNFAVGSYNGNSAASRDVDLSGIQPDLVWIKRASGSDGVSRPSSLVGNANQSFVNVANGTGIITAITSTGISITSNFQVNSSGETYRYAVWRIPTGGSLAADIVDSGGTTVGSPTVALSNLGFLYDCSTSTGTLGTTNQRIRISNTTTNEAWVVSIAATDGAAATWSNTGDSESFDFNDPTSAGCVDGTDGDGVAGLLSLDFAGASINPEVGCSAANVSLGSAADFDESNVDSITLASASSGADVNCYWDITGIELQQEVPEQQPSDTYDLNLTITSVAL